MSNCLIIICAEVQSQYNNACVGEYGLYDQIRLIKATLHY